MIYFVFNFTGFKKITLKVKNLHNHYNTIINIILHRHGVTISYIPATKQKEFKHNIGTGGKCHPTQIFRAHRSCSESDWGY